jgi:hypothetical protein
MPSPGLSLFGFMSKDRAHHYLREACVPADLGDAALDAELSAATAKLGPPNLKAGQPDIQPIPQANQAYIQQMAAGWPQIFAQSPNFAMVEIAPLLALQFSVDLDRCAHHCATLSNPPTPDELFALCLPLLPLEEQLKIQQQPQSILLKAQSLNIRIQGQGMISPGHFGIIIGVSLPFVHAVEYGGRWYLHNGFHRVYGAAMAGATHVPAMIRHVTTPAEVGIQPNGETFDEALLASGNPPTLAHLEPARAYPVLLRRTMRIINVSWSEYGMPDED